LGLRDWIIPQDKVFFDLFEEQAEVLKKASVHLCSMIQNFNDPMNDCHKMKAYENEGDDITHTIYQILNKTFITPIEPEEISKLAKVLDDILDHIDDIARQLYTYNIKKTDNYMVEMSKLIHLQAEELVLVTASLRDLKNPDYIEEKCIEINRLENLADEILDRALRELFLSDDAIRIIKLKEIYETLEIATDLCEEAANVIGDIAIKHS
jgi:uncharacterized protein Yka (UPF0111/DUF47 family)